jgi:ssDNA-binding Zn-finger/Zn-ribbon topoisomerase 1
MNRKFTCDHCKETFDAGWTEEEALEEKEIRFSGMPIEEMAILCDDCDNMIMKWARETGLHHD